MPVISIQHYDHAGVPGTMSVPESCRHQSVWRSQTDQHRLSRQHEYQAVCSCANKLTLHPGSCCYAMMRISSPAWPNGNCIICSNPCRATHIGRSVLPASRPLNGGVVTCRLGLYHYRHAGHQQQGACCCSQHGTAYVVGSHRVF